MDCIHVTYSTYHQCIHFIEQKRIRFVDQEHGVCSPVSWSQRGCLSCIRDGCCDTLDGDIESLCEWQGNFVFSV